MANTFEDMNALLNTQLSDLPSNVVGRITKNTYHELIQHSNLRTYSTTNTLHVCPRKYAKMKMDAEAGQTERTNSAIFAFGHAVGAGVAIYDKTHSRDDAIFAAFLAWDIDLFETSRKDGAKSGESFVEAIWALFSYEVWYNENGMDQWESIGIEATIAVDMEDGHFYSGHIDELMRHSVTGQLRVDENKTDGSHTIDPAKYSNSDQALSYAIVVDMLGAASYTVLYKVYSKAKQEWTSFEFVKNANVKAEWIQDQMLISQQIDDYTNLNFFPKRGASCMMYNRRCEYYETCGFAFSSVYGKEFSELPKIKSIDDIDALERVDYRTTLSEIVARQKEKLHG